MTFEDQDLEAIKRAAHELGNVVAALECQWFAIRRGAPAAEDGLSTRVESTGGLDEVISAVCDAMRRLGQELSRIDSKSERT